MAASMQLGDIELRFLNLGNFYLDGGAMFGIVPKPIWEKKSTPDSRNRIRLGMNVLLLRAGGKTILVETGGGGKWDAKRRDIYGFSETDPLPAALAQAGVRPDGVDLVINTHLHFDHAGGNTRLEGGRAVPAFPNARYVLQRAELKHAAHPTERDRGSYVAEDFTAITESNQWWLVDGETQILPGVSVVPIPGHNLSIQGVRISGGGKTVFLVADLIPTRHHLPLPWIMGYDLYPLTTLETKRRWISQIVREGWIAVFGHDPDDPAAFFRERDGKVNPEPVDLNG
jgi:glyoxylase-like metal-dependent hydrolase (beta-lactamase superfamily II)